MRRYLTTALLFLLALAAPATIAQEPPAQQEAEQQEAEPEYPTLVESIDVEVINVDVVVTDRKGNPVTGLTGADFEIYEDRRLQPVTNFYEIREVRSQTEKLPENVVPSVVEKEEEVPEHLKRKVVFFVDNLSLSPYNRNRVFNSMKEFAENVIRPGDEAMIVTWNRSLKVRVPFTPDVRQIQQTLEEIGGESALGGHYLSERKTVEDQIRDSMSYGEAIMLARNWASSVEHDLRQTVSAINGFISTMGGIQGKKIMVVTTEGFQMQPGLEMFYFIEDQSRSGAWGNTGGSGTLLEGMTYSSPTEIQSVARTANAHDITLYTIHAAGLVNTGFSSASRAEPVSFMAQQAANTNSVDSLRLMADMTGGLATHGTNNFTAAFENIERDLSSYYSLGYRSGIRRADRQRSIEVKVKDHPEYVVRSRRSFVEKSVEAEMADRVVAYLFYPGESNDLETFLVTKRPVSRGDGTFTVPVEIHIPIRNMTFLPQGEGNHRGSFAVWVAAANADRDMSDVNVQQHTVNLTDAQLEELKHRSYIYALELIMEEGRNTISVGVLDELSRTQGFARQPINVKNLF